MFDDRIKDETTNKTYFIVDTVFSTRCQQGSPLYVFIKSLEYQNNWFGTSIHGSFCLN